MVSVSKMETNARRGCVGRRVRRLLPSCAPEPAVIAGACPGVASMLETTKARWHSVGTVFLSIADRRA